MKTTVRHQTGFTLVELLVVIAIITILAALLLSSLNRSKIAADSAVCRGNLRQMLLGVHMYVQQTGVYPEGEWWPKELPPFAGAPWPKDNYAFTNTGSQFLPLSYLGPASSIYACPGYNRLHGYFHIFTGYAGWSSDSAGSYAYNSAGWVDAWGAQAPGELYSQGLGGVLTSAPVDTSNPVYRPTSEGRVASPADMFAFGDAPFGRPSSATPGFIPPGGHLIFRNIFLGFPKFYNDVIRGIPVDSYDNTPRLVRERHGGRWNAGFCDGHVENLRGKDLFDFSNPNVARRWNSDDQPHNKGWQPPPPP